MDTRQPVMGRDVISTSQPLATAAGLAMFERGGNAVDAALAAAIALTVVEPTSNGIGGDLFAIVRHGDTLHGLNASGRAPAAWTPEYFAGRDAVPMTGPDGVTVPGGVAGWSALHERFGSLPFGDLFEPAIRHASDGYPVSPITAAAWSRSEARFGKFDEFRRVFLPAPRAGQVWKSPDHAATLRTIADDRGESFYHGELAAKIATAAGAMATADLAEHTIDWLTDADLPAADGFGVTLREIPPNGQGIAAQVALRLLQHVDPPTDWLSADGVHLQIEAMKLALADLHAHVGDGAGLELLDDAYLAERSKLIDPRRATIAAAGVPKHGGTVYLCAADRAGTMISLIQSNYHGFGSGVVVPGTGIALHNRGVGFTLTPGHPNAVAPRKRPLHTIIPGFAQAAHDGGFDMAFGVMGGPMQAQGHLQMLARLHAGQGLQQACDAPRWQCMGDNRVIVEDAWDNALLADLTQRGHELETKSFEHFGGAQLIRELDDGYESASDWRKDGHAVGR
ncbi:MAG: gamma-glutamyltransferase family protein [Planctomycetota bacterium]